MNDARHENSWRGTWLSLAMGAVGSGIAIWLIARGVDFSQTRDALASSQLGWVALAFLFQMLATAFTVRRWQILLRPASARFLPLLQIYFSAHLLNTLLPAKLGTVARVLLTAESEHLNAGVSLGSVAIEKVVDTLVMLVLLLALAFFIPMPEWLRDSLSASVALVIAALIVLASARRVREPLLNALARIETRVLGRHSTRAANLARGILDSLVNLTQRREALTVLFWTMCVWLAGAAVNQLLFAALNLNLSWSATWFVIVALQLATRVPALPANLGVFHYVVILALAVYGVGESPALAFAILLHLVIFILPAFVGVGCALPLSARLVALVARRRYAQE